MRVQTAVVNSDRIPRCGIWNVRPPHTHGPGYIHKVGPVGSALAHQCERCCGDHHYSGAWIGGRRRLPAGALDFSGRFVTAIFYFDTGLPTRVRDDLLPTLKRLISILLNLCLGLFLAAGALSLVDDSLVLLFGRHLLTPISELLFLVALLVTALVYGLMGLTPIIPKRVFLPIALFYLAGFLAVFPALIYCYDRIVAVDWILSFCQVVFGLGILWWLRGGLNFRWPLVEDQHLGVRRFSWLNLSGFVLVNVFVLLPAILVYVFLFTALAVGHFSEGFMALRPNGFSVQVRKYVRNDGKTIELFPMAHVADARFYRRVSQTFPTNSIILMEGVTDDKNLLTNKITYRRMAKSLGLSEQRKVFKPSRGEMVNADVDVDQFSKDTIDFLNLIMLVHARGLNPGTLRELMQYSPPAQLEEEFINDLLRKRNQHLLEEIQSGLSQSDNLMVPWGVAHMPGIAKEIQKAGFQPDDTQEFMVIQFRRTGNQRNGAGS